MTTFWQPLNRPLWHRPPLKRPLSRHYYVIISGYIMDQPDVLGGPQITQATGRAQGRTRRARRLGTLKTLNWAHRDPHWVYTVIYRRNLWGRMVPVEAFAPRRVTIPTQETDHADRR